jgi:septum formation protein
MNKGQPALVLASASPRRQALINHFGLPVAIAPSDESEEIEPGATPLEMVSALALRKARRIAERYPESVVLGADTTVEIDGQILNKPEDSADAERILRLLRGREHHVHTGLAVVGPDSSIRTSVTTSAVRMRAFSDHELASYLATGESLDKAGGYGIQGAAGNIVDSVVGCYTNVVGLPLCAVARLLISAGVQVTASAPTCAFRGSRRCPCWPVGE